MSSVKSSEVERLKEGQGGQGFERKAPGKKQLFFFFVTFWHQAKSSSDAEASVWSSSVEPLPMIKMTTKFVHNSSPLSLSLSPS